MSKVLSLFKHPDEILPLWRMYLAAGKATKLPKDEDLAFCYGMLNKVSRSFAIVIQQLPNPLRDAVCIFYLVLRGLDTVEDDMAIPIDEKLPALLSFHKDIYTPGFTKNCGQDHYIELMQRFDCVVRVFLTLDVQFQDAIADITRRMGAGMAEFIEKEVRSLVDYNQYCHYVAGLVGVGLSALFFSSGLEGGHKLDNIDTLANEMGLFLQKTNIIRDYLEDIMEEPAPRMFWPRAVWGAYAYALEDFKLTAQRPKALQCLNHMISDALQHMPQCLAYMQSIKHPDVFKFCAIPQVMAAGTLALCYNNGKLFEGVVKMRRGQTAKIFGEVGDLGGLYTWFLYYLAQLRVKVEGEVARDDPTREVVLQLVKDNTRVCEEALAKWRSEQRMVVSEPSWSRDFALLMVVGTWCYCAWGWGTGQLPALLAGPAATLRSFPAVQQAEDALLPLLTSCPCVQQTVATLLLLLLLWRVITVKRA